MLTQTLQKEFHDLGLEIHYFKIKWYNDVVEPEYFLKYPDDTLAFVVVSAPNWFEKAFLPFLAENFHPSNMNELKDPVDQCMIHLFNILEKKITSTMNTPVEKIHDFDLVMPSRRPKVLLQTAAHISGAAYYYKKNSTKYRLGVCIHPDYGGWFGIRGIFILKEIKKIDLQPKLPKNVIPNEKDQENLLKLFNERWQQGDYRDIISVKSRYSDLQFEYFSLKPRDRIEFIKNKVYPSLEKLMNETK